ncbi:hypothetical protein ABT328_00580 [Streptomyces fumanus]|nr:hypothetical protein [Streptomyces fumanus]
MDRWDRVGRVAAYGAALALTPYPLIKVSWVVGSLLGLLPVGTGFGMAEWVVLNSATIGTAGIRISVALALVRPWGMRLPGAPLTFCAWVGTGFLVPVLPYAVLKLPFTLYLAVARPADADLPENLPLAAVLHLAAVGTGAAMLRALVRAARSSGPSSRVSGPAGVCPGHRHPGW